MKENKEKNDVILIELMTTLKAGCGLPVTNKRRASLEGLEIVAGLIRKDRTDARNCRMESLLLLTDATDCLESMNDRIWGSLYLRWGGEETLLRI